MPLRGDKPDFYAPRGLSDSSGKSSHDTSPIKHTLRLKVMLVGCGRAGKTSFSRALLTQKSNLVEFDDRTIGIDTQVFGAQQRGKKMELCLWDFAGQPEYYQTHSFFLTPRSLFVLFVDIAAYTASLEP